MINFSEAIDRLKKIKGLEHNYQVADLFGISREDFSQRKKRGTLLPLIVQFGISGEVNLNWLLTGVGSPSGPTFFLDQLPRPECAFVRNLSEIPRDIRTEDFLTIPLVEGSIAAGEPIISEDKIEGWAVIHVSQVGRRQDLVAIRLHKRDGKSMEPLIRAGSMVAIDRQDREIRKGRVYAVRTEWGCTIKMLKREEDRLILIPRNIREFEPQVLDLRGLTADPVVGRVIWSYQSFI